jgi:AcrR family transcriptional regulator
VAGVITNQGGRMRSDTRRNQRRLLEAASEVVRESPDDVTMQKIAARAEIAVATAYRYFSSVDELLAAYMVNVIGQLQEYGDHAIGQGRALFEDLVGEWIRLIGVHGPALVQLRSRRGFLERLHTEDALIAAVADVWRRPVRQLLRDLDMSDAELPYALFLYNMIFDPREILDLTARSGWTSAKVQARLTACYLGALRAWQLTD